MPSIQDLSNALRPVHWVKNFLVLAPVFFTARLTDPALLGREALAFAVFCAAASAVYLFNDWWDAPADRSDPRKRLRPFTAGRISARVQWGLLAGSAAATAAGCLILPWGVAGMVAAYALSMVLYTVLFKRWWLAGAAVIGLGMIARIFAGAAAIDVCVSAWVLPCTFFLTCYVVAGKRLFDAAGNGVASAVDVRALFFVFGTATLICYVFYALTDITIQKYGSRWVVLSAAPVALGLWRYAWIVRRPGSGREHFQSVLFDPLMAGALAAWLMVFSAIIYGK